MRIKSCPHCSSPKVVKDGSSCYGKQDHKCKSCKRQFFQSTKAKTLDLELTVKELLLERGICKVVGRSRGWLVYFIQRLYVQLGDESAFNLPADPKIVLCRIEVDEMWAFVGQEESGFFQKA